MSHSMFNRTNGGDREHWERLLLVPMPIAMFGLVVSFMFGATMGMMLGRKHKSSGGQGGGHTILVGRQGGKGHHHHGDGPPCCCKSEHHSEQKKEKKSSEHKFATDMPQ